VSGFDWLLWVAVPYLTIAVFAVGHVWRYRQDRFAWTEEWIMLFKPRALRWGIVAFHVGVLAVIGGHVLGILVPKRFTGALGISDTGYRWLSIVAGGLFGILMTVGVGAFLWRRTRVLGVAKNNRPLDLTTLVLVAVVIGLGVIDTLGVNLASGYDYRSTVAVWFRGIFALSPDPGLMVRAPLPYQLHALGAWLLFAVWPFSRLVHVWYLPFYAISRLKAVRARRDPSLGEPAA
jgi:nitrate reductase gamma subunit